MAPRITLNSDHLMWWQVGQTAVPNVTNSTNHIAFFSLYKCIIS